jgi:hypothetical protein
MTVNGESGGIWEEKTVVYFKVVFQQSSLMTQEKHEKFQP